MHSMFPYTIGSTINDRIEFYRALLVISMTNVAYFMIGHKTNHQFLVKPNFYEYVTSDLYR